MSSPYSLKTKSGEETIESIERAVSWMSRANRGSDMNIDISSVISDMNEEEERLREKYKKKTTEIAIDNLVFNKVDIVRDIFLGNLDEKVKAIKKTQSYINENFGYVRPYNLSKEEIIWLVSEELKYIIDNRGPDEYNKDEFTNLNLDEYGEKPDQWSEFPEYNRN